MALIWDGAVGRTMEPSYCGYGVTVNIRLLNVWGFRYLALLGSARGRRVFKAWIAWVHRVAYRSADRFQMHQSVSLTGVACKVLTWCLHEALEGMYELPSFR